MTMNGVRRQPLTYCLVHQKLEEARSYTAQRRGNSIVAMTKINNPSFSSAKMS